MDNLGAGGINDKVAMGAAAQGGHIDEYTFGDASADAAEAAKRENAEKRKAHEAAKRAARGF